MAKINYNDIQDMNVSWENYAGSSVEKFIKKELNSKAGWIYRSRTKEGDYYYLYGFTSYEQYEAWNNGDSSITPLFRVQLPNIENDIFAVNLSTNSNTNKIVNLGDGVKIGLKYTSTSTNPTTMEVTDTWNDGTLIISRSANGSAYIDVAKLTISPVAHNSTEYHEYDITRYLADGNNKIRIRVEDNVNGSVSGNVTFQSIVNTTLRIENATPAEQPLRGLQLQYYIEGQVAKSLNIVVNQGGVSKSFNFNIGENTYIEVPYTTPLMEMDLNTGIINVEAWLSVDDTILESYHIENQFYYSDAADTTPIILLNNINTNVVNYTNTHLVDFTLYNQGGDVTISVKSSNSDTEYFKIEYKDCEIGVVYPVYTTLEVESSADSLSAIMSISSDRYTCEPIVITIDNTEKMSPTDGADFVLNPKNRTNTEQNPARIINAQTGLQVSSDFTGFGFINDGWLSDENNIKVLRIPAEHSLEITYDVLDRIYNGTTIELDYKVYNIFNDDDVVFSFSSETANHNPLGFIMNATEATFYTAEKQTKRDQDIIFQEETRTHLAINIIPNLANSGLNFIRLFVNGVMNREILYNNSDVFKNGAIKLNFGSENCDIDIYGIRVYKKSLSATDVRQDYMSSIPNIEDKIAFKSANNILSSNGTISYDRVKSLYNTLVWTGQIPSYTTGDRAYSGTLNINILNDNEHSGTITNLRIKGQGSSSKGYWKWNHQYDMDKLEDENENVINSIFTNLNGDEYSGYAISSKSPFAKKLVSKLNWASSMQSHKIGSTALYTDLWKEIVGGNSITKTPGYEKVRVSVEEKPFLYFIKETENATPVFYGLVTFGSGKYDKPTFGYDKKVFPDYLILEGSDNGMPLTLRQVPWIDEEVTYNSGEEYYEYAGQGNLDYGMGKQENLHYFKDAFNFTYLHTPRLKPYTNDSELTDPSYQYWNTNTKKVKRYDWISETWVDGAITAQRLCEYHAATQEDVDNNIASKVGEKVIDVYPIYDELNIETQSGLNRNSYNSDAEFNAAVIAWRVSDFRSKISVYYNVDDVIYSISILKLIAASDNRCKNTYEYLDPITHKICLAQDDMDTLMLTDNVGRKTKPYYVEEYDLDAQNKPYFNGSDNAFFMLMDMAFEAEEKNMMNMIFNKMRNLFDNPMNCIQNYFFNVQEYFPAVAYNETARLLYEEAAVAEADGRYENATPPITQSLGNQLEAEKQWWRRRIPYMQSWSSSDPFYTRSTVEPNIMFRSMTTVGGNNPSYQFALTPWQWLYPKVGTGQYLSVDTARVRPLNQYTTVTLATDGNTDTYIYGSDYYTNFGEFGGVSLSEAFRLNGKRLLSFSADSRNVTSYEFRPSSMTINCPALKTLSLYGCSTLGGSLDLSTEKKLTTVELRNTGLTSLIVPETTTLTDIKLPALSSLYLVNCPNANVSNIDYSNFISLTTDNSNVALGAVNNSTNLNNIDFRNINLNITSYSKSNKMYDLLVADGNTCSGTVQLNKTLTNQEKNTLMVKYGKIDSAGNSLYVIYNTQTSSNATINGDDEIAQGRTKQYVINYNGNDIKEYSWNVSNVASYTPNSNRCSITAKTDSLDNIIISCNLTRVNGTVLNVTKTVSVTTDNQITGVNLEDMDISFTQGSYSVPINILPANYNSDYTVTRVELSSNAFVELSSWTKTNILLRVISSNNTDVIYNATLSITIKDDQNNLFNDECNIYFINPITGFAVNGENVGYGEYYEIEGIE
jgi:hypothetical protein